MKSVTKLIISGFLAAILTSVNVYPQNAISGESIYKEKCMACHTIGKGKLIGPDLKGVNERHELPWLMKWIKSSQSMVKAGDTTAVRLFNENNKLVMTDNAVTDDQVKALLAYVKEKENEPAAAIPADTGAVTAAGSGSSLFSGLTYQEWVLMGLTAMMILIIWYQSAIIRRLTNELADRYAAGHN